VKAANRNPKKGQKRDAKKPKVAGLQLPAGIQDF